MSEQRNNDTPKGFKRQMPEVDLAARLEILNGLLNELTDVLDVREVFERVSNVVQRVLPHDLMGVVEISEGGDHIRLYAGAGAAQTQTPAYDVPLPESLKLLAQAWETQIIEDFRNHPLAQGSPALKAGMVAVLSAPIRFGGRLRVAVNFFSRQTGWFRREDLPIAERIASHIALVMSHHKLAEEARQRQELEDYASKLDLLDQSLASLSDTGQLKDLIHPISKIIRQVLPHDGISVAVFLPGGNLARRYVFSGENILPIPELMEIPADFHEAAAKLKYDLVDDTSTRSESLNIALAKMGFLSVLRMPIFLNGKFSAGVAFLSKSKSTYSLRDVQAGRRIADRLALSLEREHVAEAAKRADEANARAAQLESRVRQLTDELDARTGYRRVIGESLPWREVLKKAAQVAAVETTVLLLGESGTGKEVVARFIHRGSARRDGPFVALNCAALPDNLLESELFGYERGAFTGAVQSKPGLIEQAAGGVLFLDEVGEMALSAQAKFLRVLQEREFQRLGGTRVLKADVRVVAATNRDLRKAIEQKLFREDLYFHALADDSAMFLDRKSPAYMGACTRFLLNDSLRQRFLELSDAVRYGGTSDRMALEPEFSVWVDFARSMAPMMMMASQELSKLVIESDTSSLKVLDIAAGHGLFGIAVLRANPNAMVTAVDWKNVLEVARENAEKFGVAERYRTLPGSIFDVDIDPDTISC